MRPQLSFDGKGINGPDEFRSRIATFTSEELASVYGPQFAAAPQVLRVLVAVLGVSQAAPWLARMPMGDSNVYDEALKVCREAGVGI